MTTEDLIKQAVQQAGLAQYDEVPSDLYAFGLRALNRAYEDLWGRYPLRDQRLVSVAVTVAADQEELILPEEVGAVRTLHSLDEVLIPVRSRRLLDLSPDALSQTGIPAHFVNLPDTPLLEAYGSARDGKLQVKSTSASDTTGKVRIAGTDSDDRRVEETLTLNGTTLVSGTVEFADVISVSKDVTTGRVTLHEYDDADLIGSCAPWATRFAQRRVRLVPIPTGATTYYCQALRRFAPLTTEQDTIIIARAEGAIYRLLLADLYELAAQPSDADRAKARAEAEFLAAIAHDERTDDEDNVCQPAYGVYGLGGPWPANNPNRVTY